MKVLNLQQLITERLAALEAEGVSAAEACRRATTAGYPIRRQRLSQMKINGITEIVPETLEAVARALRVDIEDVLQAALHSVGLLLRFRPAGPVTVRSRCTDCRARPGEPGELVIVIETGGIAERDQPELVRRLEYSIVQEHQRLRHSAHDARTSTAK